jgi:hypothetical protein
MTVIRETKSVSNAVIRGRYLWGFRVCAAGFGAALRRHESC